MNNTNNTNRLLQDAARWRLLALLFECPVNGWKEQVAAIAAEVDDAELKLAAELAKTEAGEGLYHAIFGPGGPAPPREVTYRSWVQPGYLLSELSAFYAAFAYSPSTPDVLDHVAVEAGFVGYLKLKEAYALEGGEPEHAKITADASRSFIAEHLTKVAEPLANSLNFSGIEYLALAGKALFDLVGKDPDAARKILPVIPSVEDEFFSCGEGSKGAGMPV
jgi:hypothetical protein